MKTNFAKSVVLAVSMLLVLSGVAYASHSGQKVRPQAKPCHPQRGCTTTTVSPPSTTTVTSSTSTTSTTSTIPPSTTSSTSSTLPPTTVANTDPPLVPWEGGPNYWKNFPKADAAGWDDPTFFPFGVWFETMYNAERLKPLGINTFVGANHDGPVALPHLNEHGMFLIAQQNEWTPAELGSNPNVVGWLASDEIDMNGDSTPQGEQQAIVDMLRARNDGQFIYSNYGKGVLGPWWNYEDVGDLTRMVDVASADLYWYTDPNLPSEAPNSEVFPDNVEAKQAPNYYWTTDRMMQFVQNAEQQPTWNFVEVGNPWSENVPAITPNQAEAAIWASIIAGARGIVLFNHSFGGACPTQHVLFDCNPAMADRIALTTSRIRELAPVLNSQSHGWNMPALNTMLKKGNGSWYLFGQLRNTAAPGVISMNLPNNYTGPVEVLYENRTLQASNGVFSDSYQTKEITHIYRIPTA